MTVDISPAEQSYNAARRGQIRHTLIWMVVKDRDTKAPIPVGLWTGDHHREFVVGGEARTYYGAGTALDADDIPGGVGLDVRYVTARLGVVPEVELAIRGYDPRLAPAEIHTAAFDLDTGNLVTPPRRVFKGEINETPIRTGAEGGEAVIEARMASAARRLTITLPLYRSDAEQRRRKATDRFSEHVSEVGIRQVAWAERRVSSATTAAPPEQGSPGTGSAAGASQA